MENRKLSRKGFGGQLKKNDELWKIVNCPERGCWTIKNNIINYENSSIVWEGVGRQLKLLEAGNPICVSFFFFATLSVNLYVFETSMSALTWKLLLLGVDDDMSFLLMDYM